MDALRKRQDGIAALLREYGYEREGPGRAGVARKRTTGKGNGLSNMEMVRQILKSKNGEMTVKELRAAIQTKFQSETSKNLPQLLHKAALNKSSIYKNARTKGYGLLEWKMKGRKAS